MIKSVNAIYKLSLGQYGKNQSITDIFQQQLERNPLDVATIAKKSHERIGLVNE